MRLQDLFRKDCNLAAQLLHCDKSHYRAQLSEVNNLIYQYLSSQSVSIICDNILKSWGQNNDWFFKDREDIQPAVNIEFVGAHPRKRNKQRKNILRLCHFLREEAVFSFTEVRGNQRLLIYTK